MSDVKSIAVVGAGAMGSGIALTAAMKGLQVWQIDVSQEQLDRAHAYHSKTLARSVEKERISQSDSEAALSRIEHVTELSASADADWVVEAATENVELKKSIFAQMHAAYRSDVVLATNTSSISITDIASQPPNERYTTFD